MAELKRLLIRFGTPLALTALAVSQPLAALESLGAGELVAACRDYQRGESSTRASTCRAFIQGYLSASNEIVAAGDRPSEFVARAMRTRASRLSDAAEQRLNSRFCLPPDESLDNVIAKVAAEPDDLADGAGAAVVMRRIFERHYLCDAVLQS